MAKGKMSPKVYEKMDKAGDKKANIKENSAKDVKKDKK